MKDLIQPRLRYWLKYKSSAKSIFLSQMVFTEGVSAKTNLINSKSGFLCHVTLDF